MASDNLKELVHIQSFLNTKLMDWYYRTLSVQLGTSAVRMFSIYVLKIPIPRQTEGRSLYSCLGLSNDEIRFIESQ